MMKPFSGNPPVTQRFGETITDPKGHRGADFALPVGTTILSAEAGTVLSVKEESMGYGNHIILAHSHGLRTLYAHLSSFAVTAGQSVSRGQVIGFSGESGRVTGPHLHFEVREGNYPVDPFPYFETEGTSLSDSSALGDWRVKVDTLLVRSGPGTDYPIVDSLRMGAQVQGYDRCQTLWLRVGPSRWIAAEYRGEAFCEPVQP